MTSFKAAKSWDYLIIKPRVLSIVAKSNYPIIISDTQIEEAIHPDISTEITSVRMRHCISRALRAAGYDKRSRRGRCWDYGGMCIEDIREMQPRKYKSQTEITDFIELSLVDETHIRKLSLLTKIKNKILHHLKLPDTQTTLLAFCSL